MVLNVPFFFVIHSIGVACFVAAGTHHPVVVYCCKILYILLLTDIYAQHIYLCFKWYIIVIYILFY